MPLLLKNLSRLTRTMHASSFRVSKTVGPHRPLSCLSGISKNLLDRTEKLSRYSSPTRISFLCTFTISNTLGERLKLELYNNYEQKKFVFHSDKKLRLICNFTKFSSSLMLKLILQFLLLLLQSIHTYPISSVVSTSISTQIFFSDFGIQERVWLSKFSLVAILTVNANSPVFEIYVGLLTHSR